MEDLVTLLPPFSMRVEQPIPGVALVTIEGELDIEHAAEVRTELRAAALGAETERVIADLSKLEFIDSSGLVALVEAARLLKRAGRPALVVVGGGLQVRRLLKITGVDEIVCLIDGPEAKAERLGESYQR
jgi:anti-anti-sigma factor